MNPRAALVSAVLLVPAVAAGDPPPKVCVAVVGDPDEAVRALADDVATRVGSSDDLRGVADAESRAALRGEPTVPTNDLTAARRALRGTDVDLPGLRALADQLGCAWFVELGARPAGTLVRVVDVVRGSSPSSETRPSVDGAGVVALVRQMLTSAATPAAASTPDAGPPPPSDGGLADASAPAGDASVAAAGADASVPRAAASATPARPEQRSLIARIWPWLLVGGLAFAGAAVAILLAPSPDTQTRITVVNPGSR